MNNSKIRIGISKEPAQREDKSVHWKIEHRTVAIDELVELIQNGHALGAICAGQHIYENYIGRQDIQVDIDSGDFGDNPIPYFVEHSFIKKYCYLIYRTRSSGHCRLLFRVSKQITNPVQYVRYATELVRMFGADSTAVSPAQLWYTCTGCDVAIIGNSLPMPVLDKLVRQNSDGGDYVPPTVAGNPETLLQHALDTAQPGYRNQSGFELALSLRHLNAPYELAYRCMERFQSVVTTRGDHPYTLNEAKSTLKSAYNHRKYTENETINRVRIAATSGVIDLPVNVRRTLYAILEAMEQIGRTTNVELSYRQICRAASWHLDHATVWRHVPVIKAAGLLRVYQTDKKRLTYTLVLPVSAIRCIIETQHTGLEENEKQEEQSPVTPLPVCCVSDMHLIQAQTFRELQHSSAAETNAKIHPKLAANDEEMTVRFGSSFQAIIAVLAAMPGGVDSQEDLAHLAGLSKRCTINTVKSLEIAGLVETCKKWRTKSVKLVSSWRERLRDLEPGLTTFGRGVLRSEKYLSQRIVYHQHIADQADDNDTRLAHDELVERATGEKFIIEIQKSAAMDERKDYAQRQGMDATSAPAISLVTERKRKKQLQPVVEHKNGKFITRKLIPDESRVATSKNGITQHEKRDYAIERLYLGHISEETFGQRTEVRS